MAVNGQVTVVLQHGNRLVRESLAAYLAADPAISVAGMAASGMELVELCNLRRPAVAVFEADAPRWNNDRLLSLLRPPGRRLRVVGVHEGLPVAHVMRAYQSGVSALVTYASGLDVLRATITSPLLTVELARTRGEHHALTAREMEVLYLISAGCTAEQAAGHLGISLHTLEHHKRRIFAKLNVHSQAHAAAVATRLGLLPVAEPTRREGEPDQAVRRGRLRVSVRGSEGALADRVRAVLAAHKIDAPRTEGEGQDAEAGGAHVVVLIAPKPADWKALEGQGGHVVVVDPDPRPQQVTDALGSGAAVVPASAVNDLLPAAVRAASLGYLVVHTVHTQALLASSALDAARTQPGTPLGLTPREREILASIGHGRTMKETATLLGISVRTVENLQSNLFRKLRVHSRAAALAAARDLGLVDDALDGQAPVPLRSADGFS